MTSTKATEPKFDELEKHKAARAAAIKNAVPTPPKLPVLDINLNYTDPEGNSYSATLAVRVFNRDEQLEVQRLAAIYAGIDPDLLGTEGRNICVSRAMVELMWKTELPEWLKVAMASNEDLSLQLASAINKHRVDYFRGHYREGSNSPKKAGLEIVPVVPSATAGK